MGTYQTNDNWWATNPCLQVRESTHVSLRAVLHTARAVGSSILTDEYDSEPNTTDDPNGFYSSNHYTNTLIHFLEHRSEEDRAKPFFGYLPFTAPHWPLQCPKAARDK